MEARCFVEVFNSRSCIATKQRGLRAKSSDLNLCAKGGTDHALDWGLFQGGQKSLGALVILRRKSGMNRPDRNLSTTLRHCRLRFTEQSLLLWMSRVG